MRVSLRWWMPVGMILVTTLMCGWIASGVSHAGGNKDASAWHHYEFLTQGFLNGHTWMSIEPDPKLAALPDPYSPPANLPYRYCDASYYRGHFYLYFGPTPVVLFLLPAKLLTGSIPPQWLAAVAFAAAGFAALVLLIRELRTAYFPTCSEARTSLILIVLFHATWLPVILRRASVWEVAIVAEVACFWWALFGLWRFARGGRSGWAAFAAAMVVAATGARPTILPASFGLLAGLAWAVPTGPTRRRAWVAAGAVLVVGGLVLAGYNVIRFGSPIEFGQKYQLLGTDERHLTHFSLRFFGFNAFLYLLQPPTFSAFFPYLYGATPLTQPQGYFGVDEMHGILVAVPIVLLALFGLRVVWLRRSQPGFGPLGAVVGAGTFAGMFLGVLLCLYPGACVRYTCEFLAGWIPVVGLGGLMLLDPATPFSLPARRILRALAAACGLWSMGYVWMASITCYDMTAYTTPEQYARWSHALGGPSGLIGKAEHLRYGTVFLDIASKSVSGEAIDVLIHTDERYLQQELVLHRLDPTHARLEFRCGRGGAYGTILVSPILVLPPGSLSVIAGAPWLYPPWGDPYWDRFSPAERFVRGRLYVIRIGEQVVTYESPAKSEAIDLKPTYARSAGPGNPDAWVSGLHWELPGL